MPNYRRLRRPGATVYFSVWLADRNSRMLVDHIDILREAVHRTRARRPFGIDAWVVLPNHMHAVWTLPEGDANYSDRWGAMKARFSKMVRRQQAERGVGYKPTLRGAAPCHTETEQLRTARSPSKIAKQDAGIWQRRFWEHHIRDRADYAAHLQHCWVNPVKHGLVARPEDWPHSSLHRDIRAGLVSPDMFRSPAPAAPAAQRRVGLQPTQPNHISA